MYDIGAEETLADLKKYCLDHVVLSPSQWNKYHSYYALSWTTVKFDHSKKSSIPDNKMGVYSFVVKPSIADHPECAYLLYVGKAEEQSLRTRFSQYFVEKSLLKGRPKVQKMLTLWSSHLWFCYAVVDETIKINDIENNLIESYIPPFNNEYPADIRSAIKAW